MRVRVRAGVGFEHERSCPPGHSPVWWVSVLLRVTDVQVAWCARSHDVARIVAGDGTAKSVVGMASMRTGQGSAACAGVFALHTVAPAVRVGAAPITVAQQHQGARRTPRPGAALRPRPAHTEASARLVHRVQRSSPGRSLCFGTRVHPLRRANARAFWVFGNPAAPEYPQLSQRTPYVLMSMVFITSSLMIHLRHARPGARACAGPTLADPTRPRPDPGFCPRHTPDLENLQKPHLQIRRPIFPAVARRLGRARWSRYATGCGLAGSRRPPGWGLA